MSGTGWQANDVVGSDLPASVGRGMGPGTAAHWEAQPPVVAQRAAAALRTRPLPQPTASSLVVESFFCLPLMCSTLLHGCTLQQEALVC